MQLAARSSFATGVAIVGAGILVAAPVKPVAFDLPDPVSAVRSASVELSAAVSPFVVTPSSASISAIPTISAIPDPGALLAVAQAFVAQFAEGLKEAPGQLNQAIQQVLAGQITQALNTAANVVLTPVTGPILDAIFSGTGPFVDLVDILQSSLSFAPPLANVVGLLKNPDFLLTVGLPLLQSVYSINSSIGGAAETVLDALKVGDLGGAVNGVVRGLIDLQGVVVTQLFAAGTGPYYYDRGLVGNLIAAGQMIVGALTAPAAATAPAATAAVTTAALAAIEPEAEAEVAVAVAEKPAAVEHAEPAAESAAAETVSAEPSTEPTTEASVEDKATSKPEVRTGLVAVPGKVTVGVADDTDKETAAPVSHEESSASGGSTAASPSSEPTAGGADSGSGSDSGSAGGSGASE